MPDEAVTPDALKPPTGLARALDAWWPREAGEAVRVALTAVVAVWLAMWLQFDLPHWAGWTVISVTLSTRAASLQKSLWRAGATVVGVAAAIVLVANFAQDTLAFTIALALWLGLLTAASSIESGQRSYGFALMGFTVPIVTLADVQHPQAVFHVGVDRCSTILLGIACAYASNVFVAPGVPIVRRGLADRLDATAADCAAWMATVRRGDPGPPPVAPVMALGQAVSDAFTEHPSLRSGGRAIRDAARRLRRVLAAGLLRAHLPERTGARATRLVGDGRATAVLQIARIRVAARLLRRGARIGRARAPFRPHLLIWNDLDWDGRHAVNNGLRTVATVLGVNGFWYATGWTDGSGAATWASLLCVLLAAHPDPAGEAGAFLVGAMLAAAVGLVVRFTLLTATGAFGLLAAVLLPVCMLAVVGRSDKRAIFGNGYGFFVLGVIDPTNVMTYDLGTALNTVLAELLGMGVAVIAFSGLPPPVGAAVLRRRARRRLIKGVHAAARDPACMLPPRDRWLARAFGRLDVIASEEDSGSTRDAQALLLIGLLLVALREEDDRLGRAIGGRIWAILAARGPDEAAAAGSALDAIGQQAETVPLQGQRIAALIALTATVEPTGWPGLRGGD